MKNSFTFVILFTNNNPCDFNNVINIALNANTDKGRTLFRRREKKLMKKKIYK